MGSSGLFQTRERKTLIKKLKMEGKLGLDDFEPSGKIEITVEEVRMIGRDGVAAGAIYPKSLFESACYKKYTVLMMDTQAVMMIIVILANLLLLLTGLKRYRQYKLMKLQKKQLDLEHHTSQKADAPPSYEKVVIET